MKTKILIPIFFLFILCISVDAIQNEDLEDMVTYAKWECLADLPSTPDECDPGTINLFSLSITEIESLDTFLNGGSPDLTDLGTLVTDIRNNLGDNVADEVEIFFTDINEENRNEGEGCISGMIDCKLDLDCKKSLSGISICCQPGMCASETQCLENTAVLEWEENEYFCDQGSWKKIDNDIIDCNLFGYNGCGDKTDFLIDCGQDKGSYDTSTQCYKNPTTLGSCYTCDSALEEENCDDENIFCDTGLECKNNDICCPENSCYVDSRCIDEFFYITGKRCESGEWIDVECNDCGGGWFDLDLCEEDECDAIGACSYSEWFFQCKPSNEVADSDLDGVWDTDDNCPQKINSDQTDTDGDFIGDVCDNCMDIQNSGQLDSDSDGIGEVCDNCPEEFNPDQADSDNDGIGDVCQNSDSFECGDDYLYEGEMYPTVLIGEQCWFGKNLNVGTMIPGVDKQEQNGVLEKYCIDDDEANCLSYGGLYQLNEILDAGGICPSGWHVPSDAEWHTLESYFADDPVNDCDPNRVSFGESWACSPAGTEIMSIFGGSMLSGFRRADGVFFAPGLGGSSWSSSSWYSSATVIEQWCRRFNLNDAAVGRDYYGDRAGMSVRCILDQSETPNDSDDSDGDGKIDSNDNCPSKPNPSQGDDDSDGVGDACDNCASFYNPLQEDSNDNYVGDACDTSDSDSDGIVDYQDNCPSKSNPSQTDSDSDNIGDACDNCVYKINLDQSDNDDDEIGDVCDNCPESFNPEQSDTDTDKIGDVCDNCDDTENFFQEDTDEDGVGDICDNCLEKSNPDQIDSDGDEIGDECEAVDSDGDGVYSDIDCDDGDSRRFPGAYEDCDDNIDNDCDGKVDYADDNCELIDNDGDNYYNNEDCNDNNPEINPGAEEDCNDGIDNDCDYNIDDSDYDCTCSGTPPFETPWEQGYFIKKSGGDTEWTHVPGVENVNDLGPCEWSCLYGREPVQKLVFAQPYLTCDYLDNDNDGYKSNEDCDDSNSNINPGAVEICDDDVDNDCDEKIDSLDDDCRCKPPRPWRPIGEEHFIKGPEGNGQWEYIDSGDPGLCQWTCKEGYEPFLNEPTFAESYYTCELINTCTDDDNGNHFVKGTAEGDFWRQGVEILDDTCDSGYLVEYYCEDGIPKVDFFNCQELYGDDYHMYRCINGACVNTRWVRRLYNADTGDHMLTPLASSQWPAGYTHDGSFMMAVDPQPGSSRAVECLLGNGDHITSLGDPACNELGYVWGNIDEGTQNMFEIIRCISPDGKDHVTSFLLDNFGSYPQKCEGGNYNFEIGPGVYGYNIYFT